MASYEYQKSSTANGFVRQMLLFRQMKAAVGTLESMELTVGGGLIRVTLPEGRELSAQEKSALDATVAAHAPASDDTIPKGA